jgi:hypothetical protein
MEENLMGGKNYKRSSKNASRLIPQVGFGQIDDPDIFIYIEKGFAMDENFSYLTPDDVYDIVQDGISGDMHTAVFYRDDKPLFTAVIEIFSCMIYVREVGGNFPANIRLLESYCEQGAKLFDKKIISFRARRKAVERIGNFLGYKKNRHGDFEKVLNGW